MLRIFARCDTTNLIKSDFKDVMDVSNVCQKLATGNYWLTTDFKLVKKDCWIVRFFKNLCCQYEHIKAENVLKKLRKGATCIILLGHEERFCKVFNKATGRNHRRSIHVLKLNLELWNLKVERYLSGQMLMDSPDGDWYNEYNEMKNIQTEIYDSLGQEGFRAFLARDEIHPRLRGVILVMAVILRHSRMIAAIQESGAIETGLRGIAVECLLEDRIEFENTTIELTQISNQRRLAMARMLLDNEDITYEDRGTAVLSSVEEGWEDIVNLLLPEGIRIHLNNYEEAILIACQQSRVGLLSILLESAGGIRQTVRDQVAGQVRENENFEPMIVQLLMEAPTLPGELENDDVMEGGGHLNIALSDVRENPGPVLADLAENGISRHVSFTDQRGIDAGGLLAQLITDLSWALVEKKLLSLDDFYLLKATEGSEKTYRYWGAFLSKLYAKNGLGATTSLITGRRVSDKFFEILKIVAQEPEEQVEASEKTMKAIAKIISDTDPQKKHLYTIVNNPESEEAIALCQQFYGLTPYQAMGDIYREQIRPYFLAAKQVLSGASRGFKKAIALNDPVKLSNQLQGKPINGGVLAGLVSAQSLNQEVKTQVQWIKKAIPRWTLEEQRQFLYFATGAEALFTGLRIGIQRNLNDQFVAHTCFKCIDVPDIKDEATFLMGLKGAMSSTGFNTG